MFLSSLLLCFSIVRLCLSIPIDNGVIGEPEIECGSTSISALFNTQNPFEGHVYVKNLYSSEGCRTDGSASIELPFDSCNVARTRSLNPKGVFVSVTVIITFHPLFMTKVDRAYKLQCFYMEADKTVTGAFTVSMIPTEIRTEIIHEPLCRYEILEGGPQGTVIQYALIGDQVYHKWICETNTENIFCIVVYSCFVDDGMGNRIELVDADGCSLDKHLIGNIEYPNDLEGGVEAHVFKFPDKPALSFQCQIEIVVKEPDTVCIRPDCPIAEGLLGSIGSRNKRSVDQKPNSLDVRTDLNAIDIDDQVPAEPFEELREKFKGHNPVCFSYISFGIVLSTFSIIVMLTLGGAMISMIFMKR